MTYTPPNLVYNGDYEETGNPAVPDGNYVSPAASDDGATFFADSRLSTSGRHSLVLRAPSDGNGITLSPYRLSSVEASKVYKFSVYLKGDGTAGQRVEFKFGSVFSNATTLSLTTTTAWKQHEAYFESSADYTNGAGWLTYSLSTAGRVDR